MASPSFEIMLGRARHPLVLALDVGSTASRGAIYDANGSPVRPRSGPPSAALLDLISGEVTWLVP